MKTMIKIAALAAASACIIACNKPRNAGTVSGGFTITYDMATAE